MVYWIIPPPRNCPLRGLIKEVLITPISHCGRGGYSVLCVRPFYLAGVKGLEFGGVRGLGFCDCSGFFLLADLGFMGCQLCFLLCMEAWQGFLVEPLVTRCLCAYPNAKHLNIQVSLTYIC